MDYQVDEQYLESVPAVDDEGRQQAGLPTLTVSFFRGAESDPSWSESLHDGDEVMFGGARYRVAFDYDATLRISRTLWWIAVAMGWGLAALSFVMLSAASPVYAQGSVEATEQGSRVVLKVDILGDEQRRQRELRAVISPEPGQ